MTYIIIGCKEEAGSTSIAKSYTAFIFEHCLQRAKEVVFESSAELFLASFWTRFLNFFSTIHIFCAPLKGITIYSLVII